MPDKLLGILKAAGIDEAALTDDILSGLNKSLQLEIDGAASEKLAEMQGKLDEMDKRRKNQDAKISEYDVTVKDLRGKLEAAQAASAQSTPTVNPNFEAMLQAEIAPLRELVTQMAETTAAQAKELEQQKAISARRDVIDSLAQEMPLLKDPRFAALMPETTDAVVLKKYGETLTELARVTEVDAFQRIRDGHIPASAPPRVTAGNEGEFQAEMKRIRGLEKAGQMTPQDASAEIQRLAKLMKPE